MKIYDLNDMDLKTTVLKILREIKESVLSTERQQNDLRK